MKSFMLKEKIQSKVKLHHLAAFYQMMIENKDNENAIKMLELYEKLDKKEMMISFAGHFSAGKSSMINTLLGTDILPKSPVPTSANIVEISSGEGTAHVFFRNQEPVEYKEPYDIDMIKEYSKDKDAISKLEISTSQPIIPPGCIIMDTPGIDAADDADRLMTEASLHLVDALFYVMDYNHVQSEVNLQFLKGLQDQKIPFYVIINQIDKHDETELAFYMFDKSIKQTFDQWNLCPIDIFYCSLFAPAMKQNDLQEIKHTLFTMMEEDEFSSVDQAVKNVIASHKRFLKNMYEEKLTFLNLEKEETMDLTPIEKIQMELDQMDSTLLQLEADFHHELQQTLKNAYLMPSSLRDKAELFLESRKTDFKAGLFNSKKKTELARKERHSDFTKTLQETMEAAIEWRLRDKFTSLLKNYAIHDPLLQKEIQRLKVVYSGENLIQLIKPGAKLNGDFVLNYTNDVSADIKKLYKQKARILWGVIYESVHRENKQRRTELEKQINYLQQVKDNNSKKAALEQELNEKSTAFDLQLESDTASESAWKLIENEQLTKQQPLKMATDVYLTIGESEKEQQHSSVKAETKKSTSCSAESILKSVGAAIDTVKQLPGFQTIIDDLRRKQERLTDRSYTIALFGAFSAGKSSFANALLGESVLPVSPNPTTAAVNRINPVTEKNRHGTVVVTFKDKEILFNDLQSITNKFSPPGTEFEVLLDWVQTNQIHRHEALNHLYQSYLQALINGYSETKENIGNKITIDLDTFTDYVTDETKACYIESIDLYYDCSVTRQGITLVDTPGADSVNARHTNASFDYIKFADAILYVTYYNHALSRADKDFLMQLGRVKEAFELDKMFFIINAADLANDDEELQLVTNYVENQLIQLGIRFPRLYPVSSKQSLQNKLGGKTLNPQMDDFEKAFFHFIHHDLTSLTVKAALWDIERMYQQIQHYLHSLDMDNKEKESLKQTLTNRKNILNKIVSELETSVFEKQINQKVEKQLFYVMERLSIRFHDMFKEMFNPTTISATGKQAQMQLQTSLQKLIDYVAFELLQELQAVSLRVESEINLLAKEVYYSLAEQCKEIDDSFTLPDFEMVELKTPAYQKSFLSVDLKSFDKILANFKSTKTFFEKNEKEIMKEQLYEKIEILAGDYVNQNKLIMQNAYHLEWAHLVADMKTEIKEKADNHMDHYVDMLSKPVDLHTVKEKEQILKEILEWNTIQETEKNGK